MPDNRDDDVSRDRNVKPGGLLSGPLPGDPTEGRTATDVAEDDEFDAEAEMARLEARRGEGHAGEISGVQIGTPAGATSDVLRNREPVPVREDNKGQQKDRRDGNGEQTA